MSTAGACGQSLEINTSELLRHRTDVPEDAWCGIMCERERFTMSILPAVAHDDKTLICLGLYTDGQQESTDYRLVLVLIQSLHGNVHIEELCKAQLQAARYRY